MKNRAGYGTFVGMFATLTIGCGESSIGMGKGGPEFPSQSKLQDLAGSAPAKAKGDERPTLAVDDWQLNEGDTSP
ncbi:MAG TPA: hypothetical protein VHM25_08615, partial [Polyangiaceae bacterium]|nr:hypothetical protein [Polyangiaceae bacterium]